MSRSINSDAGARAALESLAARALTDAEWQQVRTRLLEFVRILRCWNRHAEETKRRSNKVVTIGAKTSESVLGEAA